MASSSVLKLVFGAARNRELSPPEILLFLDPIWGQWQLFLSFWSLESRWRYLGVPWGTSGVPLGYPGEALGRLWGGFGRLWGGPSDRPFAVRPTNNYIKKCWEVATPDKPTVEADVK